MSGSFIFMPLTHSAARVLPAHIGESKNSHTVTYGACCKGQLRQVEVRLASV